MYACCFTLKRQKRREPKADDADITKKVTVGKPVETLGSKTAFSILLVAACAIAS